MKLNRTDFRREEKHAIQQLFYEGCNVHEIADIMHLSFYETIYLIHQMIPEIDITDYVSYDSIDEEKVLIISDTHLGSKYENLDYLREAYKFAEDNNIHTILHGGDLIQSTMTNVLNQYRDEIRQVQHVITDYPYSREIQNYILFGNHDYNTLKKNDIFWEILDQRQDFHLLGFKKAYLTWLGNRISLNHTTKKYKIPIPKADTELQLKGHSHKISYYKEKSISIPTLSDDFVQLPDARPGFLVGTIKENYIILDSYYFTDSLHREGKILTKKIK